MSEQLTKNQIDAVITDQPSADFIRTIYTDKCENCTSNSIHSQTHTLSLAWALRRFPPPSQIQSIEEGWDIPLPDVHKIETHGVAVPMK